MFSDDQLKQLGKLLDERLEKKLGENLKPISIEISKVSGIEKALYSIQNELKSHGKSLKSIKKTVDTTAKLLDKEQMSQRKQIAKIEERVGLTHAN